MYTVRTLHHAHHILRGGLLDVATQGYTGHVARGNNRTDRAQDLRVGNKYRIGRKIGSGSFGDIYLGKDTLEYW